MKTAFQAALAGLMLACAFAPIQAREEDKPNPAVKPLNRDIARHKLFLKRIADTKGEGEVIFLGDSITQGWEGAGQKAWAAFKEFKPVNLGIGGDQTGHVLWRITEGKELADLKPKAAVIMIGTNNTPRRTGGQSAEQIAGGVKAIVEELKKQKPGIKILVLGVFPRGDDVPKDAKAATVEQLNKKIPEINKIISKLDDGKQVFFKDIGGKFLDKDGTLPRATMPDMVHLSPKAYEAWAEAIKDDLAKLVK